MSLLPRAPQVLLRMDAITIQRPSGTADSEGNPTGTRTTVAEMRGTLASISATESLTASQRNTVIDKALAVALGTDVMEGDRVTVNGVTYEVVSTDNRRLYRRALMRIV